MLVKIFLRPYIHEIEILALIKASLYVQTPSIACGPCSVFSFPPQSRVRAYIPHSVYPPGLQRVHHSIVSKLFEHFQETASHPMTASNTAFTVFSAIGFLLSLIPLWSHLQSRNVGTCMYMIWTAIACLIHFVDSIVWSGNTINWAPVWCDIGMIRHALTRFSSLIRSIQLFAFSLVSPPHGPVALFVSSAAFMRSLPLPLFQPLQLRSVT